MSCVLRIQLNQAASLRNIGQKIEDWTNRMVEESLFPWRVALRKIHSLRTRANPINAAEGLGIRIWPG